MLSRIFIRKGGKMRLSPQARALLKMAEFNVGSANCTLIRTADGAEQAEDLGGAVFLKNNGRLMIKDRALFITTPDGIQAENRDHFQGMGEILSMCFLHERVPRVIECRVEERIRFSPDSMDDIDPKVGIGYKLIPLSDVIKQEKRSSLRFSHQPGQGSLPVYFQVLFDAYVWRTDLTYPTEGAGPPWIEDLQLILPEDSKDRHTEPDLNLESLVKTFKNAMRSNPTEERTVHVSKPYLDEILNRSTLLELGFSDVLGLGNEDIGHNLYIKKPLASRIKDRRDPHYLPVGTTLVLHYGVWTTLDGHYNYYELVSEISKGGLENITIHPQREVRQEQGLKISLVDFSVNGVRFVNSQQFMEYALGKNYGHLSMEEQLGILEKIVLQFNFYPRLRFNRDNDPYRPDLPKRVSILGRIVGGKIEWEEDEGEKKNGRLKSFGVKFMCDPVGYSTEHFLFDRWEIIRPFKENRYFKEVHKSLNGLIAYLESQL